MLLKSQTPPSFSFRFNSSVDLVDFDVDLQLREEQIKTSKSYRTANCATEQTIVLQNNQLCYRTQNAIEKRNKHEIIQRKKSVPRWCLLKNNPVPEGGCHQQGYAGNPLTPIGSNSTQENSPRNSPDFAASPACFGWPARSRHTAACMHRFFHILRRPRELAVWFMSKLGVVAFEQARTCVDLLIISSGFETAAGVRGLKKVSLPE